MEKYLELAYQLHDLLISSKEYINLKEKEQAMLNDSNAYSLIMLYKKSAEKYGDFHSNNSLDVIHSIKLEMDLNPLVIEYKKAYKEYQILIGKITELAFDDFYTPSIIDNIRKL